MTTIVPLSKLLQYVGEEKTGVILSRFTCSSDKDEEIFIREKAVMMEKKHVCRTYLFVDHDVFIGFFTVGLKCTTIDDGAGISRSMRSKLSVNPKTKIAQCFLLAQICRSDDSPKGFGRVMMDTAFDIFIKGDEMFGCRAVRLDCKPPLIDYYRMYGFTPIRRNVQNDYVQMIRTF